MRIIVKLIFAAVLICGLPSISLAAEHTVKRGETLTQIGKVTGFTVSRLAQMNGLTNPDRLQIDQRISYFDATDIAHAILWCEQRQRELSASDPNAIHFGYAKDDLQKGHVRYSIDEPTGTHFTSIFVYAEAWRSHHN